MSLTSGTRLGPYEITGPLGAGGMGEVYRARDSRLGRDVAVKALPEAVARDPERVARFEREARLLASLQHPNVGGIFGLEEADGLRYLILEFVEGETLAARLARGALPRDESMAVCAQIAAAVEAAHEAGVVHRDLKPGNVMLKPDGSVKVLDFGLAKASDAEGASGDLNLSASPTMTFAATAAGVILGTAAYMSPEQARGRAVDRRTDIWSFGCVLYECLTGRSAFEGETVSDLVARILEREPDWAAVPTATPAAAVRLLRRCLTKDARERLRDIGEARIALAEAMSPGAGAVSAASGAAAASVPARDTRWRPAALVAGVAVVALAAGLLLPRLLPPAPVAATRLAVVVRDQDAEAGDLGSYAISPDGRTLVFSMADSLGAQHLFVRPLDQERARMLEGTEGAQWPFWSPDSRDIAFFADGRLRRVPSAGGAVRAVCNAANGRGGSWGSAGTIVFAPDPRGGLYAVDAAGGTPRVVTHVDSTAGENSHRFPSFLSDGRHFLFAVITLGSRADYPMKVGSIEGARLKPLGTSGSAPVFAAPDRVVYASEQALLARHLDLRTLEFVGEPRLLPDQPSTQGSITLSPQVSCSRTGVMVYTPADPRPVIAHWLDREGRLTETRVQFPAAASTVSLSPDGRRVAVGVTEPAGSANWVGDLERGTATQIVAAGRGVASPRWNPAGAKIAGPFQGGLKQVDAASGADSSFDLGDRLWHVPTSWSADGRTLILATLTEGNRYDLQTFTPEPGARPKPYLGTAADETAGVLSHDGRLLAYLSDASGRTELYVERFPSHAEVVRAGVTLASTQFDVGVAWRADNRELYFTGGDGYTQYAVEVSTAPRLALGEPRAQRRLPRETRSVTIGSDGRVLVLLPKGRLARSFTVVQGWMNEPKEAP